MKKGIFLDRDGVVIKERGEYNYLPEHVELVNGIDDFMKTFREKGYVFVIISNQGGIARGFYSHEEVRKLHQIIAGKLAGQGLYFLDWYYCPHHDKVSKCLCRKPGSLMLEKALAKHGIDPERSWFIGDKDSDVDAGQKAGVNTLKINANDDLRNYTLD